MKAKLTERLIKSLKPKERAYEVVDTKIHGLRLRVSPTGRKFYSFRYRTPDGRHIRRNIGESTPIFTIKQAREKALEIMLEIQQSKNISPQITNQNPNQMPPYIVLSPQIMGGDPNQMPQYMAFAPQMANQPSLQQGKDMTVAELCDDYMARGSTHKAESTIRLDESRIRRHIRPLLGGKHIRELTRGDISKFIRDIQDNRIVHREKTKRGTRDITTGGDIAARSSIALLSAMLTFAVEEGFLERNVALGVKRPTIRKVERFLSADELGRLGLELQNEKYSAHARNILLLLLLTGCRKNEIAGLKWQDIDTERRCIRLPKSKTGSRLVPVGIPVLDIIGGLRRYRKSEFVFPRSNGASFYGGTDQVWEKIQKAINIEDCRIHDLRHTFASIAAELGFSMETIGALLGHSGGTTTSKYVHFGHNTLGKAATKTAKTILKRLNLAD